MDIAEDNYIRTGVLEGEPLHPSQHTYRAGRSNNRCIQINGEYPGCIATKKQLS